MKRLPADISVRAYESDGLVLEQYAYTAGAVEPIPKHSHEAYQFALSFDHQGEYTYRGEKHQTPAGRLSIIHSGEVHAPSDRPHLDAPAHFAMANIHPKWLTQAAAEISGTSLEPFFATVLPKDDSLNQRFLNLSRLSTPGNSQLSKDSALFDFLSHLVQHHTLQTPSKPPIPARSAIIKACDYLAAHCTQEISLEEIAGLVGLSRFHFCRLFRQQIGISAGAYQMQLRIKQAKKLIIQGNALSEVAIATGFYDQSHFGKHFKRHVGATPARYVSSCSR